MFEKFSIIEDATVADIEAIADFQVKHALEVEGLSLEHVRVSEGVAEVFQNHNLGFYIVARANGAFGRGKVVGTLLVTREWSDWRARFFWWIQSVYVAPEHRRQGIAKAMIVEVQKRADAAGVAGLRLYVEKANQAAQALYASLGFDSSAYLMFEKKVAHTSHTRERA